MERQISLQGFLTTIADRDDSHYLSTISHTFEGDTLSVFSACCAARFNVLDIGANIGLTAIALGRLCHEGKVAAIEPSPETFRYLTANVAASGLTNVNCQNLAASSAAGELMLAHPPSFSAGGFISPTYQVEGCPRYGVRSSRVDEIVERLGIDPVDFIKIDVEGFELEVLRGARRTLEKWKPVVFCEVNHWCLNVLQRKCLPDFVEELFAFFPHVFAIDADLQYLDLSVPASLCAFYHAHTTRFAYMNLLCGFDKETLRMKLDWLPRFQRLESDRNALRAEADLELKDTRARLESEIAAYRQERVALANSRSMRYTAPLRRLMAFKRGLARA